MVTTHSFKQSLSESENYINWGGWQDIYEQAFPTMIAMHAVVEDGWAQRGGIDRLIVLASGQTITIDEKVRQKWYGDILLEYYSSVEHKTAGWIAKDLACDYIAYLVLATKKCYLLPFHQLRAAWKSHRNEWVNNYKAIDAINHGYTTRSVAVPIKTLFAAMAVASVVEY